MLRVKVELPYGIYPGETAKKEKDERVTKEGE